MKNWLIGKVLGFIGRKLDGYKTKIGGIGLIMAGVIGIIAEMFPDQGLPRPGLEVSLGYLTGGFAVLGIGHKVEKVKAVVQAQAVSQGDRPPEDVKGPVPIEAPAPREPHRWDGRTPGQFP